MARDNITKVLDLEGSLKSTGEEAAEWSNDGDEGANEDAMEKVGVPSHLPHRHKELQW